MYDWADARNKVSYSDTAARANTDLDRLLELLDELILDDHSFNLEQLVRKTVQFTTERSSHSFEDVTTAKVEFVAVSRSQSLSTMRGMKAYDAMQYAEKVRETLCQALTHTIKEAGK